MNAEGIAHVACEGIMSYAEKNKAHKVIQQFVKLYYEQSKQTWGATKWRGVNVFKAPTDLWIYQELIHEIKPDIIIETGTCCGGSALYMADILRVCGLSDSMVVTVELDVTKVADIVKNDSNILVYEGSSVDDKVFERVKSFVGSFCKDVKVMVILDSDHTKDHVLKELELYASLVSKGSILIVEDTIINGHPVDPTYGPGPLEALEEWELDHPEFELNVMCEKLMLTFNRGGYFERKVD